MTNSSASWQLKQKEAMKGILDLRGERDENKSKEIGNRCQRDVCGQTLRRMKKVKDWLNVEMILKLTESFLSSDPDRISASEEIPFLNTAIRESTKIENEVQLMLDSVERITKKCGRAPTNYLQSLLPGIDLEKYEYLNFIADAVMNDDNLPQLKTKRESSIAETSMCSSTSSDLSFFSESIPNLMSESLLNHSIPESPETPHRKISEIWNNHNKLHCEKIKLSYQLQSTQTALNRTVAASRKLPLFTKSDMMKLETPVRETKFLRRTSSTSRCYVKKRAFSFEKFSMSSSFSEVAKWQRWRIRA
jgi:hypothetical protein